MEDVQLGRTIRSLRTRRGWRQQDLADAARVSRATVSRIEGGHLTSLSLGMTRSVCAALEVRLDLTPRWRGGELDRMLSVRHSRLHESVARTVAADHTAWVMAPEVSFSIWGERGVIDLLLWHAGRRALLVVELKTEVVDVNELIGTLDRKRRLARQIGRERGWDAATVSAWVVIAESRTNERRIAEHRTVLRAAYPVDGRGIGRWLGRPVDSVAALSLWPGPRPAASPGARSPPTMATWPSRPPVARPAFRCR